VATWAGLTVTLCKKIDFLNTSQALIPDSIVSIRYISLVGEFFNCGWLSYTQNIFNLVFRQENAVIRWAMSDVQAIGVGTSCISENTWHTLIKC
jgi:hypothetical protein